MSNEEKSPKGGVIEKEAYLKEGMSVDMWADIRMFSGDEDTHSVARWAEDIEENACIFGWTPRQTLVIARRRLTGTAALWLRSEKPMSTFEELKAALSKEFPEVLDSKRLHEILSSRKKKPDETYYQYMLVMRELGKRGKLADYITIKYIVDGIQGDPRDKIIFYGVNTYPILKEKLSYFQELTEKLTQRAGRQTNSNNNGSRFRRCFKCNDTGHLASECDKPRAGRRTNPDNQETDRKSTNRRCFRCGGLGHFASDCKKELQSMCVSRDPSSKGKSIIPVGCGETTIDALVDSGSEVNLLSADVAFEGDVGTFVKQGLTLTGLGGAQVRSYGTLKTEITITGHTYNLTCHVVRGDAMPYRLVLGQPFLEGVTVVLDKGIVEIKPQRHAELLRCLTVEVDEPVITTHIPDVNIRQKIGELINNYQPKQLQEAPLEMRIILKDDIPVVQRPRRLSSKEEEIVNKQMDEWLKKGVIKESFSEYASPLVLVRKKDGSTRVCVDYRKINEKMVKDEFPLPVIDDHLDKLSGAKIFSKLDLKDAFFHLKIRDDCTKFTAFVTPTAQYEFLRAPFGLSICPNYFTRYVTSIFRKFIAQGSVLIFIDDIIIPAEDYDQAACRLEEVLKVAAKYGLVINWKKCDLLTKRVEYLGHIVENGTVCPSADKTKAVLKFPRPENTRQVHSFIGLTSYFRKFIENYANIARPLTDLLKKEKTFYFGVEEEDAFLTLKKKLAEEPVLGIFNPGRETELHTDASQQAYSGILLQRNPVDKALHPIYYMSRKTSDAEKKYTSYELEALAIVESVKKFRKYLLGIKFKIVTDCLAFEMTIKKKDLTTRVARWILLLQEYDYTVEHRSGTKMKHVDALSRNPHVGITTRASLKEQIKRAQQTDEGLKAIFEIIKEKPYLDYYEQGGLLYKGEKGQLVIPKAMELEIIKHAHANGHFGKKKMIDIIDKDNYITNLPKKIEDFIVTCIPCLLATRKEGKQEGFLNAIEKEDIPLSTLHCDHVGPMSETNKKYNCILTLVDAFTKFVWLFPTKGVTAVETVDKLRIHQQAFGNPDRIITDKGVAFTGQVFREYCEAENIRHITTTTGVPRGNGQVERIHRIIKAVLTKLCIEDDTQWYRHVSSVQRAINSTYQRSVGTSPYELLIGTKMRQKEDLNILSMIKEESREEYVQDRRELRERAKVQILRIQEENRRSYNRKRKESAKYSIGDRVAIKRTQFGTRMKLKPEYLGPYEVSKVNGRDRYEVVKVEDGTEGPWRTTTAADYMKRWPEASE